MAEEAHGNAPAKVLVVDDHPIVREAVAGMLRTAGYLVFEAGDGEDAVEIASSVGPELVIMDVVMPGLSGIEATERIVAQHPATRVVMLSVADSAETVRAAVRAGAASYLTKAEVSEASLIEAARKTVAGDRVFIPASLVDALVREPARLPELDAAELTLREKEIISLVAQGAANSAIATALGLSHRTVENHLARVYRKLGVTSRTQLTRMAIDQQMDHYPWAGQTCTILAADVEALAARSPADQMALRDSMYEILREAFARSGMPWPAGGVLDRGDGVLVIVPPGVPASTVAGTFLPALAGNLRRHNSAGAESVRVQLRVALDAGPVAADTLGASGEAIIRASRLADATAFAERLRASGADLGVIVSESVYNTVIRQDKQSPEFTSPQSVHVRARDLDVTAWMWFSRSGPPPGARTVSTVGLDGGAAALELVDDFLTRGHGAVAPDPFDYENPVIVLEGPRGIGKSSLLAALWERISERVPVAIADCAFSDGDARALLFALAVDLNRRSDRHGVLQFPRLLAGLIAITANLDAVSPGRARDQVSQLLEVPAAAEQAIRELMTGSYARHALGSFGLHVTDAFVKQGTKLLFGGRPATPRRRRILLGAAREWWGHQDRELRRDPLDVLAELNWRAGLSVADEYCVEELLLAAFLADLRSNARKDMPASFVLLLDNADSPAGRKFLGGFLNDRQLTSPGGPGPLTVVATSRGTLSRQFRRDERAALADASYADYLWRGSRGSRRRVYAVALPGLTSEATLRMTEALDPRIGNRRAAARMVHDFTAGHPGTTTALLSAIRQHPHESTDLPALLSETADSGQTVEESMLSRLLEGIPPDIVDDLTTYSAARHQEAAMRLARWMDYPKPDYQEAFSEEFWWPDADSGHAVLPPVLRHLLLRRLSRRDETRRGSWTHVHELLKSESDHLRDEVGAMYHALALGDVRYVADRLAASLEQADAREWLRVVHAVTAAPNRLDHRRPLDELTTLTQWADRGEQPLASVAHLVAAFWICSDPLNANHRGKLYQLIAAELNTIAGHYIKKDASNAFYLAGRAYQDAAIESGFR